MSFQTSSINAASPPAIPAAPPVVASLDGGSPESTGQNPQECEVRTATLVPLIPFHSANSLPLSLQSELIRHETSAAQTSTIVLDSSIDHPEDTAFVTMDVINAALLILQSSTASAQILNRIRASAGQSFTSPRDLLAFVQNTLQDQGARMAVGELFDGSRRRKFWWTHLFASWFAADTSPLAANMTHMLGWDEAMFNGDEHAFFVHVKWVIFTVCSALLTQPFESVSLGANVLETSAWASLYSSDIDNSAADTLQSSSVELPASLVIPPTLVTTSMVPTLVSPTLRPTTPTPTQLNPGARIPVSQVSASVPVPVSLSTLSQSPSVPSAGLSASEVSALIQAECSKMLGSILAEVRKGQSPDPVAGAPQTRTGRVPKPRTRTVVVAPLTGEPPVMSFASTFSGDSLEESEEHVDDDISDSSHESEDDMSFSETKKSSPSGRLSSPLAKVDNRVVEANQAFWSKDFPLPERVVQFIYTFGGLTLMRSSGAGILVTVLKKKDSIISTFSTKLFCGSFDNRSFLDVMLVPTEIIIPQSTKEIERSFAAEEMEHEDLTSSLAQSMLRGLQRLAKFIHQKLVYDVEPDKKHKVTNLAHTVVFIITMMNRAVFQSDPTLLSVASLTTLWERFIRPRLLEHPTGAQLATAAQLLVLRCSGCGQIGSLPGVGCLRSCAEFKASIPTKPKGKGGISGMPGYAAAFEIYRAAQPKSATAGFPMHLSFQLTPAGIKFVSAFNTSSRAQDKVTPTLWKDVLAVTAGNQEKVELPSSVY